MRAIAADAGLSVGNAYYYFASKEHLIQGFYDLINAQHRARSREVIAATDSFPNVSAGCSRPGWTSPCRTTRSRPSSSGTPPTRTRR